MLATLAGLLHDRRARGRSRVRSGNQTQGDGTLNDIDAIDFFRDDAMLVDPFPYFDALRGECPVRRESHHDVVMVTGYDEAVAVYNDPDTFSSCSSVTGPFPGFPVPLDGDDVSELITRHRDELPMSDQIITFDPPVHTDHRALLMRLITPKRLKENEEFMWRLADQQLDAFLAGGEGEYIREYAGPFALLVIADLLGVPDDDRAGFAERLLHPPAGDGGVGSTSGDSMAHSPLEYLYERFTTYVEARRRAPRPDVLTGLATATFPDGSTPEVIDVVRVAANLFAAGQETTVRLLSSAVLLMAEDPALQARLRSEPERIPNFIEETLRMESPVKGDFRLSRVPTTVGSVDLPAGTTVMLVNAAANRDPRHFDDPATFDIERANARQHLAFGRGVHACPGAPLARAEARVSIQRLLDRTSDIRISEREHGPADARRYQYVPTFILRGLTRLHVEFTPA
jgi:cytochrome P450